MRLHSGVWACIAGASVFGAPAAASAQCVETTQRIADPFGAAGQRAGTSVALLGSFAIIGMPEDGGSGSAAGAVLGVIQLNGTWVASSITRGPGTDAFDRFGTSVAIDSGPAGTWVAIGAPGADSGAGLVYVYRVTGGTLSFHASFRPGDIGTTSGFGATVAIRAGATLRVAGSAPAFASDAGAVATAIINPAGGLTPEPTLFPPQTSGDRQTAGISLALTDNLLAIGAPDRTVGALDNAGAVHLYRFNQAWTYGGVVQSQTPAANARFGAGVSVKPGVIAVGAPASSARGSAEVFEFDTLGVPQFRQRLQLSGGVNADWFGAALALSDDGRGLIVGAPRLTAIGPTQVGAAEYFRRGAAGFESVDVVVSSPINAMGRFGESVAWSEGTAVVGEPGGLNRVGGIATGAATFLDVFPTITVSASPISSSKACGASATFSAAALPTTLVTYQWLLNGQPLVESVAFQGVNTPTLTVASAGPPFEGSYQLRITSLCGVETLSGAATLTLTPTCAGDADSSGAVNFSDITTVLSNFGVACP